MGKQRVVNHHVYFRWGERSHKPAGTLSKPYREYLSKMKEKEQRKRERQFIKLAMS